MMHLALEPHGDQFNLSISSAAGRDPFVVIRGCRVKDGPKGRWISMPATKNEKTGKWWNHAWISDAFQAAVLREYDAMTPKTSAPAEDDAPPF